MEKKKKTANKYADIQVIQKNIGIKKQKWKKKERDFWFQLWRMTNIEIITPVLTRATTNLKSGERQIQRVAAETCLPIEQKTLES